MPFLKSGGAKSLNGTMRRFHRFSPHDDDVQLLIVGLAPGLRGANRTGRPFTGDYAGELLYSTLCEFGFATGKFEARPDDSLRLVDAGIVNAVRCVPPENKPVGSEINNCRQFFSPLLTHFKNLRAVVTLGTIAHQSTVRAMGRQFRVILSDTTERPTLVVCVYFRATIARGTTRIPGN